jgi:hypothetical protein
LNSWFSLISFSRITPFRRSAALALRMLWRTLGVACNTLAATTTS